MSTTDEKKARARKWVNGYTVAGTAVVIAAIIPGTDLQLALAADGGAHVLPNRKNLQG